LILLLDVSLGLSFDELLELLGNIVVELLEVLVKLSRN